MVVKTLWQLTTDVFCIVTIHKVILQDVPDSRYGSTMAIATTCNVPVQILRLRYRA